MTFYFVAQLHFNIVAKETKSHHPSFISLLSTPGFGILNGNVDQHSSYSYILNGNEDQQKSSSLSTSPHQLIYEN
ncbi:hypothetical protein O181_012993 [Austropuccinia psidii MF-1]|uniref:Uncharacterized protein n=1 Tax=Austropuccinia psidii MF-1 TaxID=1389203 RepID=A0A9Q3BYD7_9BASI|nr:hypothetical protein [Austropuccinia psidii MF-1]